MTRTLKFRRLSGGYAVMRRSAETPLPEWETKGDFTSISRTPDELSIVCPTESVPNDVDPGTRWRCFKLEGPFPFSQTGVLLSFIEPLSRSEVPIFAISTFDTDYVLVQEQFAGAALAALQQAGHELVSGD